MKKNVIIPIAIAITLLLGLSVGAVTIGSQISREASSSNGMLAPDAGAGLESRVATDQLGMGKSAGNVTTDRSVIKTASLSLETKDVSSTIQQTKDLISKRAGFIDSWSQQANDAGQVWNVSASIRVPAEVLETTLTELSKFGRVTAKDINNADVTTQVLDIDARVAVLKASVERLTDLVAKAKSTADLIAAESALSQRQAELQSLEQQQKYLKDQVAMATIWLQVYTEGLGPISTPTSFIDGIVQGWKTLLQFTTWFGVAAGWLVPWLLILIPLSAAIWWVIARVRKVRN